MQAYKKTQNGALIPNGAHANTLLYPNARGGRGGAGEKINSGVLSLGIIDDGRVQAESSHSYMPKK